MSVAESRSTVIWRTRYSDALIAVDAKDGNSTTFVAQPAAECHGALVVCLSASAVQPPLAGVDPDGHRRRNAWKLPVAAFLVASVTPSSIAADRCSFTTPPTASGPGVAHRCRLVLSVWF